MVKILLIIQIQIIFINFFFIITYAKIKKKKLKHEIIGFLTVMYYFYIAIWENSNLIFIFFFIALFFMNFRQNKKGTENAMIILPIIFLVIRIAWFVI